ncbi:tetratricopeptide repeat protein [Allomuricauda sp. SCSIO 65647]|uniref:tetratricopeptide repeat protein n=1 Tax=Allomuricauda sp. SCSIO 65647 TaxID=2908843 RepID=UPI001F428FEC|nr:tetratricopeptide repeat protein [Muricauda sp. SCSIO 65647]UJH66966.1 tetratricopeptide repeat protein [Muricauda sp. SCSIO 65647]
MKTRILIALTVLATTVGFAQKDEIKAAEKAMKNGDAATAKAALEGAASTVDGADAKLQAHYYFVKGNVYADLAQKGDTGAFEPAIEAYQKTISVEEESGKAKYSNEAKQKLSQMTSDLVNAAVADNNNKKFKEGAEKLYMSFKLSPTDTIYLYYAASSAVNGAHYDEALAYYNELKELNYDGSETKYSATEIASGETVEMAAQEYDLYKKSNAYKDFKEEKTPSKKAEIVKNIALIYQQQGKNEEALAAYEDAIKSNPDDVNLVLNKANLYYTMGDKDKFKELMAEASAMAPDNPDLLYNIGVINMEQGNIEEARDAYKKALAVDPSYVNALLNLSTTYVNEGNALIDEMNSLGTSRADTERYEELKQKKDDLFQEGATVLEEALKANPDNESILTQLKNIYGALGDTENFMRVKKLLGE